MRPALFAICVVVPFSAACGDDGSSPDAGTDSGGAPGTDAGPMPGIDSGPRPDGGPPDMPINCSATTPCFYVTEDGAGARDGSSWANAYAGLPYSEMHEYVGLPIAELERGAAYLFADGTYPGYVLGDQGGGDARITLAKATVASHGDDAGWDDTMGDGEALFSSDGMVIVFSPGARHYRIDGMVGEGKSPGAYGFRFFSTLPRTEGAYMVNIDSSGLYDDVGNVTDIAIRHVDFDWDNGTPSGPCSNAAAIQVHGPQPNGDWTIASCYIHHATLGAAYLRSGSNYTFENNYIYLMGDETGPSDCPAFGEHGHWETFWVTIGEGFTLRGNTFENAYAPGQTGWVMLEATNVLIEENLFFCSDPEACAVGGNGVIGAWSMSENHDVLITHNTFRDFYDGAHFLFEMGTNIVIRDNVYENAPGLADTE